MPIIKSAVKRVKQAEVRRKRNATSKRELRQAIKAFEAKPTVDSLAKAQSELDKSLKKHLFEKATISRRKATLAKIAKESGVKLVAKKATKASVSTKTTPKKVATKKGAVKKPAPKKTTSKTTRN